MSHASRSKKQNQRTRYGYEPIETCPFCSADVFYSHETRRWLEPRTRYVHSKLRCNTVKQSRKIAQHEKNKKAIRLDVVQELKSEIASFAEGVSKQDIRFEVMVKRNTDSDKVSLRELAVSFFPREVFRNAAGDLEPTHEGLQRMARLLHSLRKNSANKATLVFSKKFENGEWYYYNIQTREQYHEVEERLVKQQQGLENTLKKNEEILDSGEKLREEAKKRFEKMIEEKNKKKKKGNNHQ